MSQEENPDPGDPYAYIPPDAPRRRNTIEIQLPQARRKYVPGSGPKSQPISLLPVHDSTGYILDKVVLPSGPLADKTVQRKLYYVVGWEDVPAARATVPATQILTYVSPRTLENWEYQNLLKKEEERAKAEEEAKLARATGRGKRRGRLPKGGVADVQEPPVELNAAEEELLARRRAAGPSLSTPQKRRLEELTEEYPGSDDAAIRRQLFEEATDGMDLDSDELAQPLPGTANGSDADYSSRASSTRPQAAAVSSHTDMYTPAQTLTSGLKRTTPATSAPVESSPRQSQLVVALNRRTSSPLAPRSTSVAANQPHDNQQQPKLKLKPVPSRSGRSSGRSSRTGTPASGLRHAHLPANGVNGVESNPQTEAAATAASTPTSPIRGPRGNKSRRAVTTPIPATSSSTPDKSADKPTSSPTPAQSGKGTSTKGSTKRKRKKTAEEGPEEQTWEVKRLEDDRLFEVDGRAVRYFKVLWAGDWPPDQNPTWEPEENIPASLIRPYMRKKANASRAALLQNNKLDDRVSTPWVPKKYGSVVEAFEDIGVVSDGTGDDEGGGDELFVTEEYSRGVRSRSRQSSTRRSSHSGSQLGSAITKKSRSRPVSQQQQQQLSDLSQMTSFDQTLALHFPSIGASDNLAEG